MSNDSKIGEVAKEEHPPIKQSEDCEIKKDSNAVSTTTCAVMTQEKRKENGDAFSLKLKGEFVLKECSPLMSPQDHNNTGSQRQQKTKDDRDEPKQNRHKKNSRGQNKGKKRPRDNKIDFGQKICKATLLGKVCQFGDKCRYSHDVKEFLANRPEDIKEIDTCPNFELNGFCDYGIMCRVGKCHLNMATGENIRKSNHETNSDEVMNVLTKEVQNQLRKKKYPFICQRQNSKTKKDKSNQTKDAKENKTTNNAKENTNTNDDITSTDACVKNTNSENTKIDEHKVIDLSPLPQKRKLIDFSNKVYIAPLTTVGNLPFRRIMKKFGADITCGEMAVAQNLLEGKSGEWALLKRHPEEDVFGVQIAAGFPDMFTRTCEVIEREMNVDFVDLNLGCPLDLVCDKGAGASLMLREKKLRDIVKGVTDTLSCPVTIKMRTGWDENKPIAHKLVSKIQSWGIDGIGAIMIHGRSRLQRYSRLANWKYIEEAAGNQSLDLPRIPVIGNGDIFSYTDYEEKIANDTVSSTAMLARGALIKPWLPTEIKERRHWDISASERLDILKDFVKFGLEHWGSDQQGVNNTRRFLLEWISFLHRYIPVGLLEVIPQQLNHRPPSYMCGRNDLETLMLSKNCRDWIKISEMLLGPVPEEFQFEPKHKANSYK